MIIALAATRRTCVVLGAAMVTVGCSGSPDDTATPVATPTAAPETAASAAPSAAAPTIPSDVKTADSVHPARIAMFERTLADVAAAHDAVSPFRLEMSTEPPEATPCDAGGVRLLGRVGFAAHTMNVRLSELTRNERYELQEDLFPVLEGVHDQLTSLGYATLQSELSSQAVFSSMTLGNGIGVTFGLWDGAPISEEGHEFTSGVGIAVEVDGECALGLSPTEEHREYCIENDPTICEELFREVGLDDDGQLRLHEECRDPSSGTSALTVGDEITGTLADGGEATHRLTLHERCPVTITLVSDEFDPVLALIDDQGFEEAFNDDSEFAAEGLNSRLDLNLAAGTYTVFISAAGSGGGSYKLAID